MRTKRCTAFWSGGTVGTVSSPGSVPLARRDPSPADHAVDLSPRRGGYFHMGASALHENMSCFGLRP